MVGDIQYCCGAISSNSWHHTECRNELRLYRKSLSRRNLIGRLMVGTPQQNHDRYVRLKTERKVATEGFMQCKVCGEQKSVTCFHTHPNMKNGRRTTCKPCRSKQTVSWFNGGGKKFRTLEKMRKYKLTQKTRYPEKHAARIKTMNAIARGGLVRPNNCEWCGKKTKPQAHHPDYLKPLDVEWLSVL